MTLMFNFYLSLVYIQTQIYEIVEKTWEQIHAMRCSHLTLYFRFEAFPRVNTTFLFAYTKPN